MQLSVLQLGGNLVGVLNLTLEEGRTLEIDASATNSKIIDGEEIIFPPGNLTSTYKKSAIC